MNSRPPRSVQADSVKDSVPRYCTLHFRPRGPVGCRGRARRRASITSPLNCDTATVRMTSQAGTVERNMRKSVQTMHRSRMGSAKKYDGWRLVLSPVGGVFAKTLPTQRTRFITPPTGHEEGNLDDEDPPPKVSHSLVSRLPNHPLPSRRRIPAHPSLR